MPLSGCAQYYHMTRGQAGHQLWSCLEPMLPVVVQLWPMLRAWKEKGFSKLLAFSAGFKAKFSNVEYRPGEGGLLWNCHRCSPLSRKFSSGSRFHLSPVGVTPFSAEDQVLPWSSSDHSIKSLHSLSIGTLCPCLQLYHQALPWKDVV